jgi:hypothetical protein
VVLRLQQDTQQGQLAPDAVRAARAQAAVELSKRGLLAELKRQLEVVLRFWTEANKQLTDWLSKAVSQAEPHGPACL